MFLQTHLSIIKGKELAVPCAPVSRYLLIHTEDLSKVQKTVLQFTGVVFLLQISRYAENWRDGDAVALDLNWANQT